MASSCESIRRTAEFHRERERTREEVRKGMAVSSEEEQEREFNKVWGQKCMRWRSFVPSGFRRELQVRFAEFQQKRTFTIVFGLQDKHGSNKYHISYDYGNKWAGLSSLLPDMERVLLEKFRLELLGESVFA